MWHNCDVCGGKNLGHFDNHFRAKSMFSILKLKSVCPNKYVVRKFSQNLSENFAKAGRAINNPANKKDVSNETKLRLYAYFKQAEAGACTTDRPGLFDPVGRAKYDAWKGLANLSKEDAMKSYVELVTTVFDGTRKFCS